MQRVCIEYFHQGTYIFHMLLFCVQSFLEQWEGWEIPSMLSIEQLCSWQMKYFPWPLYNYLYLDS